MSIFTKSAAAATLVALAACGGTSTSGTSVFSAADEARRTFADTAGDAGAVIAANGTLATRGGTATGVTLQFGGGATALKESEVAIRRNANGEITMTLNGTEHAFQTSERRLESDGKTYGYAYRPADGTSFDLYSQSGEVGELLATGNGYSVVVSAMGDLPNGNGTLYHRSYAALGAETQDAAIAPLTGTATFNGYGRLETYPTTNFIDSNTSRNRVRGDVTMTADFDANTISGHMDGLTLQAPGASARNAMAGQVDFGTASFSQNTFTGAVSSDATLATSGLTLNSGSAYTGAFFGPAAQEVSGVINGTGTLNGTAINTIGYFTQ
jgi:hypothetical protein